MIQKSMEVDACKLQQEDLDKERITVYCIYS
jgi:hypothetical protein